jgi:hypothetical protein
LLILLPSAIVVTGDRFLPPQRQKLMIPIDPTFDVEGNELADQIIQERSSFAQLRILVNGMTYAQKIAVAQIACNQMAGSPDCLLADLILKCQGNARELDNLVGVLDNHLASCEMERDNLLGIESERPLTMTHLPIVEQKMIFEAGVFSSYLLQAVAIMPQADPELLGEKFSEKVNEHLANILPGEITNTLNRYLIKHAEAVEEHEKKYLVRLQANNNYSKKASS